MKSPIITMSAITGRPTREEIFEYLKDLKDNGIDQVMAYPRSGCELEYLSDEWFDTVSAFVEIAKELDISLWLYDDFNWPSGDAHGKVTEKEENRLKAIKTTGEDIGTVSCRSRHNSTMFGEKFFPNLLSEEAVDLFIECTHEQYYKHFGEDFGSVIKGIFTDEPAIGYSCTEGCIPYYEGMEQDYADYCGRDFREDLLSGHKEFYRCAIEVISRQFNRCFVGKISDWCKSHGILMAGHLMSDHTPFDGIKQNGDLLKNLSTFSLPGIDDISTVFDRPHLMTLFGVAEYVSGENGAMAELFALGPCDMTYAKKRCMLYFAACHKIDHYFMAISHMDLRGNTKITDYFNVFTSDQPDFVGMRILSEEAKQAAQLARLDYEPDVYIKYPYELCSRHVLESFDAPWLWQLTTRLAYNQIQWKYVDSDDAFEDKRVIDFTDDFEYVFDGKVTSDTEEICRMIGVDPVVTDLNGDVADGIFVRRLINGQFVVLNLFAPEGEYLIDGKKVRLFKHDVYLGEERCNAARKEKLTAAFNVKYGNPNVIRAMYINDQNNAEIEVDADTEVIFAVRQGVDALLDGKQISCANGGAALSRGLRNLYSASDKMMLKKGTYTVTAGKDFKYLPSVFVVGDFSAETENGDVCKIKLHPQKTTFLAGDELSYYGKVELTATVIVPQCANAIELKGAKLYTRLYADGVLIDEKIASPYVFHMGDELRGKQIRLCFEQYSSIAPAFGDVKYQHEHTETVQWKEPPAPEKTLFGFEEINWIF